MSFGKTITDIKLYKKAPIGFEPENGASTLRGAHDLLQSTYGNKDFKDALIIDEGKGTVYRYTLYVKRK